jgi:hypothetical protein
LAILDIFVPVGAAAPCLVIGHRSNRETEKTQQANITLPTQRKAEAIATEKHKTCAHDDGQL